MKVNYIFLILLFSSIFSFGQKRFALEKDIDFDGVIDTIYVNQENSKIVCILSSKKYAKVESKIIGLNTMSGIGDDGREGFVFENHYMRAGYSNQFRYDKKTKKIRLIGIEFYEFCGMDYEICGESSINLLTGNIIGKWHYLISEVIDNVEYRKVKKIPIVNTKINFKNISFKDFDEEIYFDILSKISEFIETKKRDLIKR